MDKPKLKKYFSLIIFLILVIIFVTTSLFNFNKRIQTREYYSKLSTLKDISFKGKIIVENKLEGYLNSLQSIETFLDKEDIHSKKNLELILSITEKNNSFFHRIGIANMDGYALVSSGESADISDRKYFKDCLEKKSVITGRKNSDFIPNVLVFMVSVPIIDSEENVIGVLFGAVEIDKLSLYKHTGMDENSQYIQIIDKNGVYISKEDSSRTLVCDENLFDGIRSIKTKIPVEEIIQRVNNRESVLTEVKNGADERIIYFTPLEINDWYIVTVMKKDKIVESIKYLLENDVYILMFKVMVAVSILCAIILYDFYSEKKKILKLNENLTFNDEIFKIASDKFDFTIMIYDLESKSLKLINNGLSNFSIPSIVENAPTELPRLFPNDEINIKNFKWIFESIGVNTQLNDFNMPFIIDGETRHLRIQVHNLFNEKGKIVQCVGIMTDITDNILLKKEVQFRETLLSNTIGFIEVDLDEDLILRSSDNIAKVCANSNSFSSYIYWEINNSILPKCREYVEEHLSIPFLREAFNKGVQDIIYEYQRYTSNGKQIWLECSIHLEKDTESKHIMAYNVMRDINKKKNEELRLIEKANKDELTNLFNRREGIKKIDQILKETDFKSGKTHAFMLFDLDKFKLLNDTLGHQMGDTALKDVADILNSHFRSYDILCRLGGDEFVVFLKNIPIEVIEQNTKNILNKLNLCYDVNFHSVNISASVGIALAPLHGTTFKDLYSKADIALYQAKKGGKNTFKIFSLEDS